MTRMFQFPAIAMGGLLLVTAWATSGGAITVPFTDSNQLDLTGRQVLSAVSFYDSDPSQVDGGIAVTGPIQGVAITNFDYPSNTTIGELTVVLPNPTTDRGQTGAGIVGTGADQAHAIELARSITFWSNGNIGSLSYAFGPSFANAPVEVQVVGGEQSWDGVMNIRVGSISQGTLAGDTNTATADLLTFSNFTDVLGNLVLDVTVESGNFYGIAGVLVTTDPPFIPEPSTLLLVGGGAMALMGRSRRHRR